MKKTYQKLNKKDIENILNDISHAKTNKRELKFWSLVNNEEELYSLINKFNFLTEEELLKLETSLNGTHPPIDIIIDELDFANERKFVNLEYKNIMYGTKETSNNDN